MTSESQATNRGAPAPWSSADLFDACMNDSTVKLQVCRPVLRSFGGLAAYAGRIVTVRGANGCALRLRDVLGEPGRGRVLVADGEAAMEWALLGDRMAALGAQNDWSGILLNGCVRDVAALRGIGIGVHALGAVPSRPQWPAHPAHERDIPLRFAGCVFESGRYLYADEDGILLADKPLV